MAQDTGIPTESSDGGQPRGARRQLQILEAALRVIAERGVAGLTFRAVAEDAGVGLGVVTYHFPNRRALLGGALRLHLDQMRERGDTFETLARGMPADARSAVDAQTDAIVQFLRTLARDDRASVVTSHELALEMTRDAQLTRDADAAFDAHRRNTATLVARTTGTEGSEEDAAIASAVFDQLILGWIARPGDHAYEARVRRIVRRVVERILRVSSGP